MRNKIIVGILDDDESKKTTITTRLILPFEPSEKYDYSFFENYDITPVDLELTDNMEDIVTQIRDKNIDCVIIDYKLNGHSTIDYNGTEIAELLKLKIIDFPLFILTSYDKSLFDETFFDAYQVFDCRRYEEDESERFELNQKIVVQVRNYKNKVNLWKKELISIQKNQGLNSLIDDKIVELNRKIRSSLNIEKQMPFLEEKMFISNKMDELLNKLEKILGDI